MAYSNASKKGREFLRYLTDLSVHATLFAPNDSGLKENEVRDFFFFFLPCFNNIFKTAIITSCMPLKIKLKKLILVWCAFCITPYNLNWVHKRHEFIVSISLPRLGVQGYWVFKSLQRLFHQRFQLPCFEGVCLRWSLFWLINIEHSYLKKAAHSFGISHKYIKGIHS